MVSQKAERLIHRSDILFDIKGKRVLITGSSTGIGACTAELFAAHGADVGIHYKRSSTEANDVLQKIKRRGGNAAILQADLLESSSYKYLVDSFIEIFGGIDACKQCWRNPWFQAFFGIG